MNKKDIVSSIVIGEICAWLLLIIAKDLGAKIPFWWLFPIALPLLSVFGILVAYWLGKKIIVIYQLAKFLLVGVLNTLVDLGILNLIILFVEVSSGIWYSIFKGFSFLVAVINSYFWNKWWTFEKKGEGGGKEFSQFLMVSVIGFGINVGIASLVVNISGPQLGLSPKIWANVGAVMATLCSMLWNFVGYKFIVFK